ncbi:MULTISPECIES: helix-turn-helix domain-containing protein [Pectobacterium]|uniref:helix-turn-helix domain-containing protein n=1 Tax=Pectobacterium TaxID=122277 RepID=UPI00057F268D|nr:MULTISPECIES: helix-turn-helix transcriptional regulator [Pectobacterium]KHS70962.1 hypothetical protein RC77_05465 [Pectobacterium brasiliense]
MDDVSVLFQLGQNISVLRNAKGISQEKLGELTGLDRTYVSSVERGKRNISLLNLVKLATALNTSPAELLIGIGGVNE